MDIQVTVLLWIMFILVRLNVKHKRNGTAHFDSLNVALCL